MEPVEIRPATEGRPARAERPRGFWPLRDIPAVVWLVAAVAVAFVHPFIPAPRWLLIHLLLLGAISHSIVVWSRHFTMTLLHVEDSPANRRSQSRRLVLLNLGVLAVVLGVPLEVWPLVLVGATAVAAAAAWHGWAIWRMFRAVAPSRFRVTSRYYVAAACFLPVGATFGVLLAHGLADPWHARVMVAHAVVNLLGWVGLTVVGTLVPLWPTILRTRITEGSERATARAMPVLVAAVVLTATAALLGSNAVVGLGLVGYLAGLAMVAPAFVDALRRKHPDSFPAWSVLSAVIWLVGCLTALALGIGLAADWTVAGERFSRLTPFLAAGFGAQLLLGALAFLIPVGLGGGPAATRAANAALDRAGPLRVALTNAGLILCLLPAPSLVRVLASVLVLGALMSWLPLLVLAMRASKQAKADAVLAFEKRQPVPAGRGGRPAGQAAGLATVGVLIAALAAAIGVALDPAAVGVGSTGSADAGVAATGEVTTVAVVAKDMRFHPGTIEVPAGNRLVIKLTNGDNDGTVHDLVLDSGARTQRLAPGKSATLDVGVVGRDIEGWCSVLGHRQMGMVMHIRVTGIADQGGGSGSGSGGDHQMAGMHMGGDSGTGDSGTGDSGTGGSDGSGGSAADDLDFMADPPAGFQARDAALPPLTAARVHRRTFTVRDVVTEVAPGVTQRLWTYDGTAPGPILHGRVGDRFVITLVNDGTIGHSIDFHAGSLAPQQPMRTIAPGESLVYRFHATRSGIWMYHCSTMPMAGHIANGLFGAVVIEPPDLPAVARSYVLVQSEFYLGEEGGTVDMSKVLAERPDAVVFNGYANQYDHDPLPARVGERVRVWVLDAGPNRPSSFHVIGSQFDTTYAEGAYLLRPSRARGGAQSLGLQPAQGGFVELTFPEPGDYPFVSHLMVDAERGAHGLFRVTR